MRKLSGVIFFIFSVSVSQIFAFNGKINDFKWVNSQKEELNNALVRYSEEVEILGLVGTINTLPINLLFDGQTISSFSESHTKMLEILMQLSEELDDGAQSKNLDLKWIEQHFEQDYNTFEVSVKNMSVEIQAINNKFIDAKNSLKQLHDRIRSHQKFSRQEQDDLISRKTTQTIDELEKIFATFKTPKSVYGVDNFLRVLDRYSQKNFEKRCGLGASLHQKLWEFYGILILSELKGLVVAAHNYHMSILLGIKRNIIDMEFMKDILKRIGTYRSLFKTQLGTIDTTIRDCDHGSRGLVELKDFTQPRIFDSSSVNQCLGFICHQFSAIAVHQKLGLGQALGVFDPMSSFYTGDDIWGCKENTGFNEGNLFKYIPSKNNYCSGIKRQLTYPHVAVASYQIPHMTFDNYGGSVAPSFPPPQAHAADCSICKIYVLLNYKVHTHGQKSDIGNNKIVTGIKFETKDNVLTIRIKEGRLSKYGQVSDEKWTEVQNFNQDVDHFDYTANGFYLDETIVEPGYVITGIKFHIAEERSGVKLKVYGTKYDFNSGKLSQRSVDSKWFEHSPGILRHTKPKIKVTMGTSSTYATDNQSPKSCYHNAEFVPQNTEITKPQTLPYISSEGIESKIPLSGVGLCYEKSNVIGGVYIAPRLFTYRSNYYIKQ